MISILAAVATLACVYYGLSYYLSVPYDPQEPPLVPSKVPLFGHLVGLVRDGSAYYGKIAKEYNFPIYTIHVPRARIYVVTSPSLISAIDRRAKSISFAPYVVGFARRILVPTKQAMETLEKNFIAEGADEGLLPKTLHVMHQTLAPGKDLDALSKVMLDSVVAGLCSPIDGGREIGLFGWIRKTVIRASTDAVYGPDKNPFRDSGVCDGFRMLEQDFVFLGLNIFPDIIAPRGSRGRRIFFDAMRKYYAMGGSATASRLIHLRYQVNCEHQLTQSDIERFDLSVSFGLLVNTVPSASWALYYIYSDPLLLAELRSTLESLLPSPSAPQQNSGSGHGHGVGVVETTTVNVPAVIAAFPLLSSVVQEVLRIQSTNASGRVVLEDTLIDDTYLLKKGAILLIPSAEVHRSTSIWGPDAAAFDAARFFKKNEARGARRVPKSAYRAFGSGASVCPGRHFAMNEILSILIVMMLQYDIVPMAGVWQAPVTKSHILTSILTPVKDMKVCIKERKESTGKKWKFVWESGEEL